MNKLKIFENQEFGKIRSVMVNNEPYFVAKDVCDILEIKNTTQAIQRLDEDERTMFNIGRQGETNIVNEYGLYNLILASRKPEAKAFKKWITHEVIPAIRKTGGYIAGEESMTEDELVLKAINVLQIKVENYRLQNQKLLEDNNKKEQIIGELKPKADYTDRILQCDDLTKVNVIACDYGFSAREFNKLLNKFGIQYKQGKDWLLFSNHRGQGYTQTKTFEFTHKDGTKGSRPNMMWTQKGRLFLYNFLKEKGIYPRMEEVN
nr:MAG TPA: repressor domain protein [Caudoviricetes sp.]